MLQAMNAVVFWLLANLLAAWATTMPSSSAIPAPESIGGQPVQTINLTAADGVRVAGWYVPAEGDRAVVLLTGISSNRRAMVSRAAFYRDRGYASVLIDFRGTGESDRTPVTIGWRERLDALAAYRFLREQGYARVGMHGISMGAAATAYAMQEETGQAFVVLESCYDTIDNALANRLAMVRIPPGLAWPMQVFARLRIGAGPSELRPVDYLPACTAPALVMAGDSEPELRVEETRAIFESLGSAEKRLHFFAGGRHQNFHGRFTEEFEQLLGEFIDGLE